MILQNLVFPKENICNEPELYFHGTTDGKIPAGNEADLFTLIVFRLINGKCIRK